MAHYYTNNSDLKSETRIIPFDYKGKYDESKIQSKLERFKMGVIFSVLLV